MKPCKLNIYQKFTNTAFLLVILGNPGVASQLFASEILYSDQYAKSQFDNWPKASDQELELQRGGFLLPNGMNIEFSIEKIVYLNGVETFTSYFQLPENGFLFQNGAENLASDLANSALNSVIQNQLDNQLIQTVNDINLEISNLQNLDLNNNSRIFIDHIMPFMH